MLVPLWLLGAGGNTGAPAWLPAGAVAHLDFVAGNYWAGGAERAVIDLLGGTFDAGADIDANGLFIEDLFSDPNEARPDALGALFTDITDLLAANGVRLVCELQPKSVAGSRKPTGPLIGIADTTSFDTATDYIEVELHGITGGQDIVLADNVSLFLAGAEGDFLDSITVQRVAAQLSHDLGGGSYEYAASINGGTVISDAVGYAGNYFTPAVVHLFHIDEWTTALNSQYVRSLTVYPSGDKSELVGLSAI